MLDINVKGKQCNYIFIDYLNHCTFFLYILGPLQLAGPLRTFNSIVGYSSKGVFPLKVYTLLETIGVGVGNQLLYLIPLGNVLYSIGA